MEITPEDAAKLLEDPRNYANHPTYVKDKHGRTSGAKEIPQTIRTLIGAAAHHDTIANVAEAFGVSPSTVAQAKKGNVGVNRHDPDLKESVDEAVGKVKKDLREVALERLANMFAAVITEETLATLKPREAVGAAKDIATIVDKLSPKSNSPNVAVFVHQPRVKNEEEYGEIIVVTPKREESKLT